MATRKAPQRPFYDVGRSKDPRYGNDEYAHLRIYVYYQPEFSSYSHIEIQWQTDRGNTEWYGAHVELHVSSNNEFQRASRIINKLEFGYGTSPRGIIEQLAALKIVRKQYHNGINRYYTEAEWPEGPTFRVFDGRMCQWAEVAKDEDEARRKFTVTAGTAIARGWGDHTFALSWLNSDKPIKLTNEPEVWAPVSIAPEWPAKIESEVS